MQGRWVGDVVWVTDWPGLGKKGDRVKCYLEAKIVEDGNAMTGRFFGGGGSATWITVYDAASKRIRETIVDSGESMTDSVVHKKNGKCINDQTGSTSDGKRFRSELAITVSDNGNKHSWSGTTTVEGQPADECQDVWIRVSDK